MKLNSSTPEAHGAYASGYGVPYGVRHTGLISTSSPSSAHPTCHSTFLLAVVSGPRVKRSDLLFFQKWFIEKR